MNGQRPARRLFPEGALRWEKTPEGADVLVSSDEEIARALSGGKLIPSFKPEPPRQTSGLPGTIGPLRVEAVRGVPHILGEGVSVPCDSRREAETELARMQASASAEAPGQDVVDLGPAPKGSAPAGVQVLQEGLLFSPERSDEEGPDNRLGKTTPEADSLLPLPEGIA